MKALEKDRRRRYESAGALLLDLRRHLTGDPVEAGPPSTMYRVGRFARKHRVGISAGIAAAMFLVLGLIFSVAMAVRANRARQESQAVASFLQNDLLAYASATKQSTAGQKADPDIKVRTVLDRAAAAVHGRFESQPQVEAAIRETIGKVTGALNLDGSTTFTNYSAEAAVNSAPEPSSVVLFGTGIALILVSRLRRRSAQGDGRGAFIAKKLLSTGGSCFCIALLLGLALILLNPSRSDAQIINPTNGLIGFWTGNDTATDSSMVGNNGTFGGSYTPGCPGGGGAAFNLATGYVYIPNDSVYDNFQRYPGWTVGFWFNANGTAGPYFFLGQDNGSGYQPKWFVDYGYTVYGPLSAFVWHVNDYNTERIFLSSSTVSPFPNGWNHLTVVTNNSSTSVAFYLNGVPIGGYVLGGAPGYVLETTAPLIFGEMEGFTYHGLMCDVALYDRALSPQEVVSLVNSGAQIQTTASGLAYSRVTKTFDGTVTVTNVSGNAASGPFQIVFASLPSAVTIANASGTYNGRPYITLNTSLAVGQSASVAVQFSNPSNTAINATPVVYTGSFN
jgi:hypothetical protein